MRFIFIIISFLLIFSCSSNNMVYWCGDHQCINKKEKESYFQKTMTVEVRDLSKIKERKPEIEKIKLQAQKDQKNIIKLEKDLIKNEKFTKKQEAKREKELLKQKKRAEKLRIKNEKEVEKQLRKDEKKRIKSSKKKNESKTEIDLGIAKIEIKNNTFSDIINRVKKRNKLKPYPDINKTID
jgi:hypothetical protein